MSKKILNVRYQNELARLNTIGMIDICEIQKEVMLAFGLTNIGYSKIRLWNKNVDPPVPVTSWSQFLDLSGYYFLEKCGLFLTIELFSPPPSRQNTNANLLKCIF